MTAETSVTQAVLQAQHLFWAALQAKDAALFETVLADSFVSVSQTGHNESRSGFVSTLVSFQGAIVSLSADNVQVYEVGDVAVLTGIQKARIRLPNDVEVDDRLAITNVFVWDGDDWKLTLVRPIQLSATPD